MRRILGAPGATVSSFFHQVVQKEAKGSEFTPLQNEEIDRS
jgi:hypothetical protein